MTADIRRFDRQDPFALTVGVLMNSIGGYFNGQVISSLIEAAEEANAHLVFFFGGVIGEDGPSLAYNLPHPDALDALIVLPDSVYPLRPTAGMPELARRLPGIPMYLFLGTANGFFGVIADEEAAIGELVAHIVDRHGYRRIALLSGPDAPDSVSRKRRVAIDRSLAARDLSIPLGLCLPGSFLAEDGKTAVARILALENDSPDVLVCLNAQMAIGAIREFAANGIAVPEDIAVVAFDDVEESGILSSDLTTVSVPIREISTILLERIRSDIAGTTTYGPETVTVPARFVQRESCGCTGFLERRSVPKDAFVEVRGKRRSGRRRAENETLRNTLETLIEESLEKGDTQPYASVVPGAIEDFAKTGDLTNAFIDVFSTLWTSLLLKHRSFSDQVFVNALFIDSFRTMLQAKRRQFARLRALDLGSLSFYQGCNALLSQKLSLDAAIRGFGSFLPLLGIQRCVLVLLAADSAGEGEVRLSYRKRASIDIPRKDFPRITLSTLIPDGIDSLYEPVAVLPLERRGVPLGYLALSISETQYQQYSMVQEVVSHLISTARANDLVREKQRALTDHIESLKRRNTDLSRLSSIDEFTGLANRRALLIEGRAAFERAIETNESTSFIFIDMDGLKRINDQFGHKEGDVAIRALADILRKSFRDGDLVVRYGGDEFLVLMTGAPEQSVRAALDRIDAGIRAFNEDGSARPWALSASWGFVHNSPGNPIRSFDESIEESDARLYEEKKRKKAGRS